MYHWKNKLEPTAREDSFLVEHGINRLYVRFFDVSLGNNLDGDGPQAMPSATVALNLNETCRKMEIIPTVFITLDALKHSGKDMGNKIYHRVKNMCEYYGIERPKEIQLDCDWTESTQETYFDLCRELGKHCRVSSTIRLHQLRGEAPPVAYGVLMLYNTNNLRDPNVKNSILNVGDVKPYLKNVNYTLPLDFAYPAFEWYLRFHNWQFCEIVTDKHRADSLRRAGEGIRHEKVAIDDLLEVKRLVEKSLPQPEGYGNSVIYHLDEKALNKYTSDEIESIFSR